MASTHSFDFAQPFHKQRHAAGGPDPITPADIGAATSTHTHSWGQVTGKPVNYPPSAHTHVVADVTGLQGELDGKAPTEHAASHATGGSDPITPASIGAQPTIIDTGWRDVSQMLEPGWNGTLFIRRIGGEVSLNVSGIIRGAGATQVAYTPPAGFEHDRPGATGQLRSLLTDAPATTVARVSGQTTVNVQVPEGVALYGTIQYPARSAVPTKPYPGTPA